MSKIKYCGEFEIKASPKMLFPYLSTANGLKEWFADDVNMDPDKAFVFLWEGDAHKALRVVHKINTHVKFEFLSDNDNAKKDLQYLDIRLDENDLTQTSFIRVTDYSEAENAAELESLWENLISNLKSSVGANAL